MRASSESWRRGLMVELGHRSLARLELVLGCLPESSGHGGGSGQGAVWEHGVATRELVVRGHTGMSDCGGDARARWCEIERRRMVK